MDEREAPWLAGHKVYRNAEHYLAERRSGLTELGRAPPQLPPHPLRVPQSAHFGVEAVGFAEVAFAAFFVAKEAGEVSGFFAEEGGQQRVAISFDHELGAPELRLDLVRRRRTLAHPRKPGIP